MADLTTPGSLVAWWNGSDLCIGVVGGEEKRKVRLIQQGGREVRVPPARLAFAIQTGGEAPGSTREAAQAAGERAAEVAERVRQQAVSCDVPLLWEIAKETPRVYPAGALAELAFAEDSGTARAALVRALLDDGLHFARKAEGWEPRSPGSVDQLRLQRRRTAERAEAKQALFAALRSAMEGGTYEPSNSATERRYLDALYELAVEDLAAPERAAALAREALDASGVRYDRPHEGAFRLLRRIGRFESDDQNLQILRHGLRTSFPTEVMEQASRVAASGFPGEGREDLTSLEVLTIDSPQTREIDDGFSVQELGNGQHRIGIHIADPAALIRPDDPVDREALARAVTHYLPERKLLMIPKAISENAASLLPGQDRPALSFLVQLDERGDLKNQRVVRSVVRSRARLSYAEADRVMEESGFEGFAGQLRRLSELSGLRERHRLESRAVLILAPEVDVHVEPGGTIQLERVEAAAPARRCVTEMMVLAGEIAARFCSEHRVPGIYRRQPEPEQPVEAGGTSISDPVQVRAVRRSLRRGEVALQPGRHFALGLEAYAQATSPLRRYQDLATHRQIASVLEGTPPAYDAETLQRIAATTEQAETASRQAERASNRYWLLRYLEQRRGETVWGVVVEREPRPMVQLDQTLLERPVPSLRGIALGERVELRVERVNPRADLLVLRTV